MKRLAAAALLVALVACEGTPERRRPAAQPPAATAPEAPPAAAPVTPPAPDAGPAIPPGVTREQIEAADAIEAWFKTLAAAARGSSSDCIAMAGAIQSVGAKGRPIVARARELQRRVADPAAAAWLDDYIKGKMAAGFNEMVAAMGLCAENRAVVKAMKAIAK